VLEKRFDPARDYYQLLGIARRVRCLLLGTTERCLLHSLSLLQLLLVLKPTVVMPLLQECVCR
jgi:hypothetical protein